MPHSNTVTTRTDKANYLRFLGRAIRTEFAKIRFLPSTYVVVLLAVLAPWLITTAVSYFMHIMSAFGEMEQNPEGMLHWTRVLGITIFMVWAVTSVTADIKHGIFDLTYMAIPRFSIILLSKWVTVGVVAAAATAIVQPLLLQSQKILFPGITNNWGWNDPETLHFLWAQPVYAFLAVGFAIGMGAIFRTAAPAVGVMLVWEFVGESFLYTTPGGADILPWLPFYNASLFAGEFQQVPSPIGVAGAGVYWVVLSIVMVALGVLRLRIYQRKR
ncbi:MAG TPA: hypothetical protein GX530_03330 [Corynebacteriales bacterium]|nr:hypothetical protein [Mycobacteriales bacterium]